jgi:hypothetical protein
VFLLPLLSAAVILNQPTHNIGTQHCVSMLDTKVAISQARPLWSVDDVHTGRRQGERHGGLHLIIAAVPSYYS